MTAYEGKGCPGSKKALAWAMMRRQEGVVILAVLWICALIMWFALQIGTESRLQGEEQVHMLRRSQALHLAIGGSYEALARMGSLPPLGFDEPSELDWQPDGRAHIVDYQTGQALVIVESENQKVNVNMAGHDQLRMILEKAGLDEDSADQMADVIGDFVDQDDFPRLKGAEKDHYQQLGLNHVPFNGPLTSLDQMLLIPGITQQLFYGYGLQYDDSAQNEPEAILPPIIPGRYSLFQMLTVYGTNVTLLEATGIDDFIENNITWQSGGIYRIISCGMTSAGPPGVVIWLTVRFAPESEKGYEVLYRKIL